MSFSLVFIFAFSMWELFFPKTNLERMNVKTFLNFVGGCLLCSVADYFSALFYSPSRCLVSIHHCVEDV